MFKTVYRAIFGNSKSDMEREPDRSTDGIPVVRVNMFKAINGRLLEICTPTKSSKHIYNVDWEVEFFILHEEDSLHDAIATILLTKGLK